MYCRIDLRKSHRPNQFDIIWPHFCFYTNLRAFCPIPCVGRLAPDIEELFLSLFNHSPNITTFDYRFPPPLQITEATESEYDAKGGRLLPDLC